MSKFEEQQHARTEAREKDRVRKEKLAGYLYNISQLTFAALVLGGITPLFANYNNVANWIALPFGAFTSYVFASAANRILKN